VTYGRWLRRAGDDLHLAYAQLPAGTAVTLDDVGATLAGRRAVYLGLLRLVELVVGEQPARPDVDRQTVDFALRIPGEDTTRLYLALSSAAGAQLHLAPSLTPICAPGRALASAAEALAVAGDILASHAPTGRQPRTPEGVAIRAGADGAAGLTDIAALTHDLVRIDAGLADWARRSYASLGRRTPSKQVVQDTDVTGAIADARWASTDPMAALVRRTANKAHHGESLLRLLDMPPPVRRASPITDGASARAALIAVRNWMYQNVGDVRAAHVAAATRLGYLVCTLASPPAVGPAWRAWIVAAHAASALKGSPPHGAATEAVGVLERLARWARPTPNQAPYRLPQRTRRDNIDDLAAVLPTFAEVIRRAVDHAARRGHFFVVDSRELERTPRSGIFHAVDRWRTSRIDDPQVSQLRTALWTASDPLKSRSTPARGAPRLARLAFEGPAWSQPDEGTVSTPLPPQRRPSRRRGVTGSR